MPWRRLQWALTSSNTSGFFFCGIMLEPVVKAYGNCTKPKFWLENRQQSVANRPKVAASEA